MTKYLLALIPVILLLGCQGPRKNMSRSFYYWKTTFNLSEKEKEYLSEMNVRKLYVRFFDVATDEKSGLPMPTGEIAFSSAPRNSIEIIPVIFITAKTLLGISEHDVVNLSGKIWQEVGHIASKNKILFREFQLDCDWTAGTRQNFFLLVKNITDSAHKNKIDVSATIRLHQVKYYLKTGIPPVDRGMLMFYNMGKISPDTGSSSIYNDTDADKYTASISDYPLPLDVALPVFSWTVQVRDKKVIGLLNKTGTIDFANSNRLHRTGADIFVADSSFFFHGSYIMKNDLLKIEEINPYICKKAALKVAGELKGCDRSIVLFDLDSINISKYEKKDLKEVYDYFN